MTHLTANSWARNWGHLGRNTWLEIDLLVLDDRERCLPHSYVLVRTDPSMELTVSFFPETLRSLVGDGSYPPPTINLTPLAMLKRKRQTRLGEIADVQEGELPQRKKVN